MMKYSKSKLREKIFNYIERRSGNAGIENFLELTEENIIKHIKLQCGNSEKQIKDSIQDLENNDEIKPITIEKDIYIYKESKEFEKKLKKMGILPFMPRVKILIISFLLSFAFLFYISIFVISTNGTFFTGVYSFLLFTMVFYYTLRYVPKFLIKATRVTGLIKNKKHISIILIILSIVLVPISYFLKDNLVSPLIIAILIGLATMIYKD